MNPVDVPQRVDKLPVTQKWSRSAEVRHLWGLLRRSKRLQTIFAVPAALSFVATLDDVGSLAKAIADGWGPFAINIGKQVARLFPAIDSPPNDIAAFLFFAPFIVIGFSQWLRGKKTVPSWKIAWLAMFSFMAVGSVFGDPGTGTKFYTLLIFYAFFATLFTAVWAVVRVLLKNFDEKSRWAFLAFPFLATLAFLSMFMLGGLVQETPFWSLIAVSFALSLPLFATSRLIQVGLISAVIVSISLIYSFAHSMFR